MRPFRSLALALLLCAGGAPIRATVLVSLDLGELVSNARVIVHGRVVETRAVVVDGRTETLVTVGTPFFIKGEGGREVVFRVPGGAIGRYRTVVVGAPVVREGDEIVAFLTGESQQVATVVGFSQGVLKVSRRSADAAPMLLSPPVARDDRAQRVVRGGDSDGRFVTLAAFVGDVRALVAGAAGDKTLRDRRLPGSGKIGGW